jgi:hypothetical protein
MQAPNKDTFLHFIELAYECRVPISGSIGRAALVGEQTISPLRSDGSIRDIDIVNVGQHADNAATLPTDLEFDRIWLSRFVNDGHLIYPGGLDSSAAAKAKVKKPVPHLDVVLEPVQGGSINGLGCITLRPEVQLAIDSMFGNLLPKNKRAFEHLNDLVAELPLSQRVDPKLLEPFQDYAEEVQKLLRRKLYLGARSLYHAVLPPQLKGVTHPLIKRLARQRLV